MKYIVEVYFFVGASDEKEAEDSVQSALEAARSLMRDTVPGSAITEFTVAWSEEDRDDA